MLIFGFIQFKLLQPRKQMLDTILLKKQNGTTKMLISHTASSSNDSYRSSQNISISHRQLLMTLSSVNFVLFKL